MSHAAPFDTGSQHMLKNFVLFFSATWITFKKLYHGNARPAYERVKPVRLITLFSALVLLCFSIFNDVHGFHMLALIQLITVTVMMIPTYLLTYRPQHIALCETFTMTAAFISFASLMIFGGYLGTGVNWIFIFPFLAFYINPQHIAWHWVTAFLAFLIASSLFIRYDIIHLYYSIEQINLFCSTYLFYSFLAFELTSLRNQYELHLEQQVTTRVQDLKQLNQQLEHRMLTDIVTQIPNRCLFDRTLSEMLNTASQKQHMLSVIVFELERFQDINNTLGYHHGDSVLQQTVQRIHPIKREADFFARIGGASFAFILPSATNYEASKVAKKLFHIACDPFFINGSLIELSLKVGISSFPKHGKTPALLLQRADMAMRQTTTSINEPVLYKPSMEADKIRSLQLFGKLRQAINQQQLKLVYQVKVDCSTQQITSVEALVRWNDHEEGTISPSEFIPLAEKSGLIIPLTQWVFQESIQQCSLWHQKGINIAISINISTRDLMHHHFPQHINALLIKHQVDAKHITLEITETSLMEHPKQALQTLNHLRQLGFLISIDDFGTGYSSLAYLKELPVTELKIDQQFIFNLNHNTGDQMIVRSTIELAHNFGLKVVAEGIENIENMTMLENMGCDTVQGFFISHPLTANKLEEWLAHSQWYKEKNNNLS